MSASLPLGNEILSIFISGPHDDRLGRLDGSTNLSKSVDINEKLGDYLNHARDNMHVSNTYNHSTLKDIARQNDQLKAFGKNKRNYDNSTQEIRSFVNMKKFFVKNISHKQPSTPSTENIL
jgi:hypothetical protein